MGAIHIAPNAMIHLVCFTRLRQSQPTRGESPAMYRPIHSARSRQEPRLRATRARSIVSMCV